MNSPTRCKADGTIGAEPAPSGPTGSGRWWVITSVAALILAACSSTSIPGSSGVSAGATSGSPGATPSSPPATVTAPALDCAEAADARAIWFPAADGTLLYGAITGSGRVGVVVANDVPHPLCETLTVARFLGGRGNRVLVFDYRDRGNSDASDAPGRLDQDVAGAVDELRSRGVARVILLGSYAGVAAAVVAATEIDPPIDGVIGISPAAIRGQWVDGPFGPIGAFRAAPRLRVPALYIPSGPTGTSRSGRFAASPASPRRRTRTWWSSHRAPEGSTRSTSAATRDGCAPSSCRSFGTLPGPNPHNACMSLALLLPRHPRPREEEAVRVAR